MTDGIFTWQNGVSAQEVGEALGAIVERDGVVTAESVVMEAEDEESPLHRHFEWDDSRAAHLHRLEQARFVVRRIRVRRTEDDPPRRVYVHLSGPANGLEEGYHPISIIRKHPAAHEAVLEDAIRDLRAWRSRYDELRKDTSLTTLFDTIDVLTATSEEEEPVTP